MKRLFGLLFLGLVASGCAVYADPYGAAYAPPPGVYVETPGVIVEPGHPGWVYRRGRYERWYYRHG